MRGLAKRGSLSHNIPISQGLGRPFQVGVNVWIDRVRYGGAIGLPVMSLPIGDLFAGDACVCGDNAAVAKPHDERRVVKTAIGVDKEARKSRENCWRSKDCRKAPGDPGCADVKSDMAGELFLGQSQRATGFRQSVRCVIAKEQYASLKTSVYQFDGIVRERGHARQPIADNILWHPLRA